MFDAPEPTPSEVRLLTAAGIALAIIVVTIVANLGPIFVWFGSLFK